MTVNPGSQSAPVVSGAEQSSNEQLRAFVTSVRSVFALLKRGGPVSPSLKEAFERAGLGPRHAPALIIVAFEGELSVSDLAEMLGLSLSTTSLLVGELSRAGIIDRAEDERDRRRTIVCLNERYRADAVAWLERRLIPFRRTLARLDAAERAAFLAGWVVLEEELSREGSDDEAGC